MHINKKNKFVSNPIFMNAKRTVDNYKIGRSAVANRMLTYGHFSTVSDNIFRAVLDSLLIEHR